MMCLQKSLVGLSNFVLLSLREKIGVEIANSAQIVCPIINYVSGCIAFSSFASVSSFAFYTSHYSTNISVIFFCFWFCSCSC